MKCPNCGSKFVIESYDRTTGRVVYTCPICGARWFREEIRLPGAEEEEEIVEEEEVEIEIERPKWPIAIAAACITILAVYLFMPQLPQQIAGLLKGMLPSGEQQSEPETPEAEEVSPYEEPFVNLTQAVRNKDTVLAFSCFSSRIRNLYVQQEMEEVLNQLSGENVTFELRYFDPFRGDAIVLTTVGPVNGKYRIRMVEEGGYWLIDNWIEDFLP